MRTNRMGGAVVWGVLAFGLLVPGSLAAWTLIATPTSVHPSSGLGVAVAPARHGGVLGPSHGVVGASGTGPSEARPTGVASASVPGMPMGTSSPPGACQAHAKMRILNLV